MNKRKNMSFRVTSFKTNIYHKAEAHSHYLFVKLYQNTKFLGYQSMSKEYFEQFSEYINHIIPRTCRFFLAKLNPEKYDFEWYG